MLRVSFLFYVIAVIAVLFGFTGVSEDSVNLGRLFLGISIGLFVINFITGVAGNKSSDYL